MYIGIPRDTGSCDPIGRKVYPIREAGEEKSIGLIVTSGRSDLRSKSAAEKIYVCRRGSKNASTE